MTSSGPEPTDPTAPQPGQPYPGQPYPDQPYPGQPYPGQPYPGQPYPGQPYPGQPYPGQPYPGQPYPGQPYPPQGYPPPPPGVGYGVGPSAPYGLDPRTGIPYSDKQKLVAGLLQIFLGGFGVGRFYIGDTRTGVLQIVVTVFTCGIGALWGLIDGILMLAGDDAKDANGYVLRP